MVASFNQYAGGLIPGALPRPSEAFADGAFGPFTPIVPMPIDQPPEGAERPEPRRHQYPIGYNLPVGQPGSEGLKLASFSMLRAYTDLYSVARSCLRVRKQEVLGLEWDIIPTKLAEQTMGDDTGAQKEFGERKQKVIQWLKRIDPNYFDFTSWLSAVIEDIFVTDALSLYLHPSRVPGKGLMGSDLAALDLIDGTTIRPLLDMRGEKPKPPAPGFQQYLYGVPRVDLLELITEADLDEMDDPDPVRTYRGDQLIYLPFNVRSFTPYGFPPPEETLLPMAIGLKRQEFLLDFYTQGSIPGAWLKAGPEYVTAAQVRNLQDTYNAIAGDVAQKFRFVALPHGTEAELMKQVQIADGADQIVADFVLMGWDVKPQEVGLVPGGKTSGLGGAGVHKSSADESERHSLKPFLGRTGGLITYVVQTIGGQLDMQFTWIGADPTQDEASKAETDTKRVFGGLRSVDEVRVADKLPAWGFPETKNPFVMTPQGPVPLIAALQAASSGIPAAAHKPEAPPPGSPLPPPENPVGHEAPPPVIVSGPGGKPAAKPSAKPSSGGSAPSAARDQVKPAANPANDAAQAPDKGPEESHGGSSKSAELRKVRTFVRHGKDLGKFKPTAITPSELALLQVERDRYGDTEAFKRARMRASGSTRGQREQAIAPLLTSVASQLGTLAKAVKGGSKSTAHFVDEGTATLRTAYHQAYGLGQEQARKRWRPTKSWQSGGAPEDLPLDAETDIDALAQDQSGYLTGLMADIISGADPEQLAYRYAMYASTTRSLYERGYFDESRTMAPDDTRIIWRTANASPCLLCAEKQDQVYTWDSLPNFPGDGGFGEFCEGAFNCNCELDYVSAGDVMAVPALGVEGEEISAAATPTLFKALDDDPHTSAIIALWLSPADAGNLALPADSYPLVSPADNLHITLAYMGDAGAVQNLDQVKQALADFAAGCSVLTCRITGSDVFAKGVPPDPDHDVYYAAVDCPELADMQSKLADMATKLGGPAPEFDKFVPHITLATGDGQPKPDVAPRTVKLTELALAVADKRTTFAFGGANKAGNERALASWYTSGAGAELIRWGTEGDLTRCHDLAAKYMDDDQAWGFCNERAKDAMGHANRPSDDKK